MVKRTDAQKVAAITEIINATDEHRNRAKRESWEAVKRVMRDEDAPVIAVVTPPKAEDEAPVVDESEPEVEVDDLEDDVDEVSDDESVEEVTVRRGRPRKTED